MYWLHLTNSTDKQWDNRNVFLGQCCLSEHLEPCSHLDDSKPVPWCSLLNQETPSPPSQSLFLPDKSSQRLAEISSQAQVCTVSSPQNVSQATPVTHSTHSFSWVSYPCCNTETQSRWAGDVFKMSVGEQGFWSEKDWFSPKWVVLLTWIIIFQHYNVTMDLTFHRCQQYLSYALCKTIGGCMQPRWQHQQDGVSISTGFFSKNQQNKNWKRYFYLWYPQ